MISRSTFIVLGALSASGPLSMDLYLPGVPGLERQLSVSPSLAQLTLSACLVGLALGQLFAGPLSDRVGRRRPLLVGVAIFAIASLGCALAPNLTSLIILRLIQGLAGAAGIVLSRAVIRDTHTAEQSVVAFSRLMVVIGAAPILAPVAGGAILLVTDWRGIFYVLAVIGVFLFVATWLWVPESLSLELRHRGGIGAQFRIFGRLIRDRTLVGYALGGSFAGAAMLTYISMSSLVLQAMYHLTPLQFSFVFAVNSVGVVGLSQLNARWVRRFSPRGLILVAIIAGLVASFGLIGAGIGGLSLTFVLIPLFVAVAAQGIVGPNTTGLALAPHAAAAGAAAALLGSLQFLIGAVIPPAVSGAGVSVTLMGVTMTVCFVVALGAIVVVGRQRARTIPVAVNAE
jgi:DHA1 family bicyclomycin/chloramphenicol resistance-like MFS transporter